MCLPTSNVSASGIQTEFFETPQTFSISSYRNRQMWNGSSLFNLPSGAISFGNMRGNCSTYLAQFFSVSAGGGGGGGRERTQAGDAGGGGGGGEVNRWDQTVINNDATLNVYVGGGGAAGSNGTKGSGGTGSGWQYSILGTGVVSGVGGGGGGSGQSRPGGSTAYGAIGDERTCCGGGGAGATSTLDSDHPGGFGIASTGGAGKSRTGATVEAQFAGGGGGGGSLPGGDGGGASTGTDSGGDGGNGDSYSVYWGTADPRGGAGYGGGGGGAKIGATGGGGSAGNGVWGGGNGGSGINPGQKTAGAPYSGGGGGGGTGRYQGSDFTPGEPGGQGMFAVRYLDTGFIRASGGSYVTGGSAEGNNWIWHVFYGSGNLQT